MRNLQWTLHATLYLTALAMCLSVAEAGKLQQVDLPPDTELVIHLDWDKARDSAPLRQLAGETTRGLLESGFVGWPAAELVADTVLHDMTLVVTSSGTFQVVRADTDVDGLRAIFADAPGYVVVKHGNYEIHHWLDLPAVLKSTDEDYNSSDPSPIYAADCGDGTYILSKQLRPVVQALERRDGVREQISDEKCAEINAGAPENLVLLVHACSPDSLERMSLPIPIKTGHATLAFEGSICEFRCEGEMANSMIAGAIAQVFKPENLVRFFQGIAAKQVGATQAGAVVANKDESEQEQQPAEEKPADGKRSLNLGFSFKNIDAETMHAMLAKAFSTTTDGAKISVSFRGVIEPQVKIDARSLSISLVLDGAESSTAAKEETIR